MLTMAGLVAAAVVAANNVSDLGWLSGAWAERLPNGEWTEEYWTPVRGELMIGAGLSGRGKAVHHFEHMRISKGADGKIAFYGMPQGAPAIVFALARQTVNEVRFENAKHDYPQRIIYRRDGNGVVAIVSLIDGSKERRWTFRRP